MPWPSLFNLVESAWILRDLASAYLYVILALALWKWVGWRTRTRPERPFNPYEADEDHG